MINLRFQNGELTSPSVTLGPAPWFRVAGNFIRQGPHGAIVGSFRYHYWEVESRQFRRYVCDDAHYISFEDAAGGTGIRIGPFSSTWGEDGLLHPNLELKAKFHPETVHWHYFDTDTYWPVMLISSVNA